MGTDILLLLLMLSIAALGFFHGTVRIILALITVYASIVLASLYFAFMAVFFTRRGTTDTVANAVSFLIIFALSFIVLYAAAAYTFRYVRLSRRFSLLDRMIATVLGLFLGATVATMIAMVLNYTFVRNDAATTAGSQITAVVQRSVRRSTVRPLMLEHVAPRLHRSVAPFLPDAAKPFFAT